MGVTLVTKIGRTSSANVVVFCRQCTNPLGYTLEHHGSCSMIDFSLIFKIQTVELFND